MVEAGIVLINRARPCEARSFIFERILTHYSYCCYAVITSASALIACVALLWRVKLARPTEILCIFAPAVQK